MSDKLKPSAPANEPDQPSTVTPAPERPDAYLDELRAELAAAGSVEVPSDESDEMQVVFLPRKRPAKADDAAPKETGESLPIG